MNTKDHFCLSRHLLPAMALYPTQQNWKCLHIRNRLDFFVCWDLTLTSKFSPQIFETYFRTKPKLYLAFVQFQLCFKTGLRCYFDCLQVLKIVHHHANGCFDWLTCGPRALILREKQFLYCLGKTKIYM